MRHTTLNAAKDDLREKQYQASNENDKQSLALKIFVREKTDEILGYNNTIAEIQKEAETASERVAAEQSSSDRQVSTHSRMRSVSMHSQVGVRPTGRW